MLQRTIILLLLCSCGDNKTHPSRQVYEAGGLPKLACTPNLNGKIEADEMKPQIGVPARYLINPAGTKRAVSLVGTTDGNGLRTFDLGTDYMNDQVATLTATALDAKWYASSFPAASFAAPFDAGGTIEAVYSYDASALTLRGLASVDPNPPEGKTLLVYDTPIAVFRFPIEPGGKWISASDVKMGLLRGQPYAGKDTYEVAVDAPAGKLIVPDFTFTQAIRVKTKVTVQPTAGMPLVTRQSSYLFECFGEVARATSATGEASDDFTSAAELRRVGL